MVVPICFGVFPGQCGSIVCAAEGSGAHDVLGFKDSHDVPRGGRALQLLAVKHLRFNLVPCAAILSKRLSAFAVTTPEACERGDDGRQSHCSAV